MSQELAEPTQPVNDCFDLDDQDIREIWQIMALVLIFLTVGLAAISMVLGYGWARVGRDWLLGLLT